MKINWTPFLVPSNFIIFFKKHRFKIETPFNLIHFTTLPPPSNHADPRTDSFDDRIWAWRAHCAETVSGARKADNPRGGHKFRLLTCRKRSDGAAINLPASRFNGVFNKVAVARAPFRKASLRMCVCVCVESFGGNSVYRRWTRRWSWGKFRLADI